MEPTTTGTRSRSCSGSRLLVLCCLLLLTLVRSAVGVDQNNVLFKEVGSSGIITLNRPKLLNALNVSMVQQIHAKLKEWESTKNTVIIKGSGDVAFSAGGDIKATILALEQPYGEQEGFVYYRHFFSLGHLIGTYKKPYVALMNGITMGGGAGISVLGKYRIATEKTLFAMPETAIGGFTDSGGSYFLSRLNDQLGMYLGLTGHRLKGIDVLLAGLATHYVHSDKLEDVTQELLANNNTNIDGILQPYSPRNIKQEFSLTPHLSLINSCFSAPTVEEIINRLETSNSEWASQVVKTLNKMSPTSLKISKKVIEEARSKSLAECLIMEYRVFYNLFSKKCDFVEGVRALLIDRDQNPSWNPKALKDVSNAFIEQKFAPLPPQDELQLEK
ncbi:3-hydroxyisobutyryl-CoA hydrolase, mitochondrial, partial [Copidosoma floridanum]|uniref:3-hydroxyisobutyryl-CoA hydrolase, mitochondrial n=1 Tax=Copidosoma floridanum TaxID=29053 RepID=UPI0006C95EF0